MNAAPQSTSTKTRHSIGRIVGLVITIIGLISAATGVLQYFGVTRLPIVSNIIHPSAETILQDARGVDLRDVSCTLQEHFTLVTNGQTVSADVTGSCLFTSNPARSLFQIHTTPPAGAPDNGQSTIYDVYDVGSDVHYTKDASSAQWSKYTNPKCQPGEPCSPTASALLSAFFALTDAQFVGAESVDGQDTYHIRGMYQDIPLGSRTSVENLWLAQDTYYPVRVDLSLSGINGIQSGNAQYDFNNYNHGASIPLPPPDQIAS